MSHQLENLGGAAFFAIVAATLMVLVAYSIFEAWALVNDKKPITGYVRDSIARFPKTAAALAFVAGLLAGHFWR